MAVGNKECGDMMCKGKHNCASVLIQFISKFIAGKAVLKSILYIIVFFFFFAPDVFMSVWHTVHISSFERSDINSY